MQHKKTVIVLSAIVMLALIGIILLYLTPDADEGNALSDNNHATAVAVDASGTTGLTASSSQSKEPLTGESLATMNDDSATSSDQNVSRESPNQVRYVQVINSCGHNFEGECVQGYLRASESASSTDLRNHMVLRTDARSVVEGTEWYEIQFDDQWLRYPDRLERLFVRADDVRVLFERGTRTSWEDKVPEHNKRIVIDVSEQSLQAFDGDELFLETSVSTGLELSPTTLGTFSVFKKTPSRYMQGPIEGVAGSDYYDLPGVPWNLYFTEEGEVIHGAYWHESFGEQYSHGCVNLPPATAERLYHWADLDTMVTVQT